MHLQTIRLRFGLILEAYYRSCGSYHKPLLRQVEAVEKLTRMSDTLKEEKEASSQTNITYLWNSKAN
jgi:phosphatidylinositol-4,5-bisphosphate 3-kinase catalytic subunit alpha/beta/delta